MPGWCNETFDAATLEDFVAQGGGPSLGLSLGAWLVYSLAVTGHLIITCKFRIKISISLLKRCSFHDIKDATKNAWTNIGLTTSLVMTTIIGALIEGHEMTPQGFCMDHAALLQTQQTFVAFCVACLFANLNCIIYCVLNLFYWDSLSETDAIAFLHQNPQVLGETVIYMVESYIFFVGAVATWIYGTYGVTCLTGIFVPFAVTAAINLSAVWRNLDQFQPKDLNLKCSERKKCCRSSKPDKDTVRWIQVMQAISEHPVHAEIVEKPETEEREKTEKGEKNDKRSEPDVSDMPATVSGGPTDDKDTNENPLPKEWGSKELSV